ncbi:MAG: hypothetical protein ACI9XK_004093 [Granulosicoccus sp.]|jgi:hypothetical protein
MLRGVIDNTCSQIQTDIGSGDAVTPGPENAEYSVMLKEFEARTLRVYPRYKVIAEKFETLTTLGIAYRGMKDYFDLCILSRYSDFEGDVLRQAVQNTFAAHKTTLHSALPLRLHKGNKGDGGEWHCLKATGFPKTTKGWLDDYAYRCLDPAT